MEADNNAPDNNFNGTGQSRSSQGRARKGKRSNRSRQSSNQRSQGSNVLTDNFLAPLSRAGIPQQSDHHTGTGAMDGIQMEDFGTNGPENFMFDTGNKKLLTPGGTKKVRHESPNDEPHFSSKASRFGGSSMAKNAKTVK